MGKSLKGKELGIGISQRKDGLYTGRYTDKYGKRRQKYFAKLQDCRRWMADVQFQQEHGSPEVLGEMSVDAWFDYWINEIKGDNPCRHSSAMSAARNTMSYTSMTVMSFVRSA